MYMLFLTARKIYISNKAGGGEIGTVIGTVQDIMTMNGVIIPVIRHGREEYLMIGEIIIEIICGVVISGILRKFIMLILIGIGEAIIGEIIMDGGGIKATFRGMVSRVNKVLLMVSKASRGMVSRVNKVLLMASKASKGMVNRVSKVLLMGSKASRGMVNRASKVLLMASKAFRGMVSKVSKVVAIK
jgi:ribosomal protein L30/L7E